MADGLASQPVRTVLFDELDGFPEPTEAEEREFRARLLRQLCESGDRSERKRARRTAARAELERRRVLVRGVDVAADRIEVDVCEVEPPKPITAAQLLALYTTPDGSLKLERCSRAGCGLTAQLCDEGGALLCGPHGAELAGVNWQEPRTLLELLGGVRAVATALAARKLPLYSAARVAAPRWSWHLTGA